MNFIDLDAEQVALLVKCLTGAMDHSLLTPTENEKAAYLIFMLAPPPTEFTGKVVNL